MARLLPFVFLFIAATSLQAQYLETFSTPNKGYLLNMQDDFTGMGWTLSNWNKQPPNAVGRDSFDYFQTTAGGVLESIDIDNEVCWESPLLNIAAAGTVSFSVGLVWNGFDTDVLANSCITASDNASLDYIKVLYSVNGGPYTMVPNLIGGAACATIGYANGMTPPANASTTVNQGGISGNTLKIRVCVGTNANAEIVQIDNVSVPQAGVTTGCAAPVIATTLTQAGSCNNANGAIQVTATGATPGYNVAWSGPSSGNPAGVEIAASGGSYTIMPLATGAYTITVTDAANCSATTTATITAATALALSTQVLNTSCSGPSDGEINLSVSNGVPPYTYAWSNLPGSPDPQDQTGLGAGSYTVTVTDNAGCTATTSATVNANTPGPYLETFSTPNRGYLLNFADDFAGVNWSMSSWANQPPAAFGRDNMDYFQTNGAGQLEAIDLDQEVCWLSPVLNIAGSGAVTFNVPVTWNNFDNEDYVNISYSLNGGAFIQLPNAAGGGAGTIQYPLPTTDQDGSITVQQTGLTGNSLQIRACVNMNSNEETVLFDNISIPQTVSLCFGPTVTAVGTDILCNGASTGSILVTASNATPPYNVSWSGPSSGDPAGNEINASGGNYNITGLGAGVYTVTVTDMAGLTTTASVTLTQPSALQLTTQVTSACGITATGSIDLTVNGGTPPYTYDWSNDGAENPDNDTQDLANLVPGNYTVTVTDFKGCRQTTTATVENRPPPSCSISGANAVCSNSTGNVYSAPPGMVSYNWTIGGSGSIEGVAGSSVTITAGASGSYTLSVTITAANGCTATCSQPVTINPLPTGSITGPPPFPGPSNDTLCTSTQYVFTGPAGMSAYEWGVTANGTINGSNTGSSVTITVNSGSSVTVYNTITDANGCKNVLTLNRNVQAGPTCSLSGPLTVCGGSTGNVYTVSSNAGAGGYYVWSISGDGMITSPISGNGITSVTVTAGASGAYTVNVTTQFFINSCGKTCSQTVTINPKPGVSCPPNGSACLNDLAFALSGGSPVGGVYSGPGVSGGVFTPVVAGLGTHTITYTVTDGNGCTGTCTFTIAVDNLPVNITYSSSFCMKDPGPVIGLSSTVNGAIYQLKDSGGNNLGAPRTGTGGPISFGSYPNGTYKVVGTNGNCTGEATANVNGTQISCTIEVPGHCTCDDPSGFALVTVKAGGPAGQNWTVKAVIGLYVAATPQIPLAVGTPLQYVGGNMYTLDAARSTTKGYWVQVTNGFTDLDIMVGNASW